MRDYKILLLPLIGVIIGIMMVSTDLDPPDQSTFGASITEEEFEIDPTPLRSIDSRLSLMTAMALGGDPIARSNLSDVYALGLSGTPQDLILAYMWLLLAGELDEMTRVQLEFLEREGISDEDIQVATELAIMCEESGFLDCPLPAL